MTIKGPSQGLQKQSKAQRTSIVSSSTSYTASMKTTVPLVFAVLIALSSCQGQEIPLGPGPVVEGNQGGGPQGGFGGNQGGFPGQQGGFGPERFGGNQGGFPGQQQGGFAPQGFGGNQGGFPGQQPGGFGPEGFGGNQGGFPGQPGRFGGNQGGFPGQQQGGFGPQSFGGNQGTFPGQGGFQGFPRRRRELQETGYGHDTLKRLLR